MGSSLCDFDILVPVVGLYISIFSVLFLLVWDLLVARRLFQMGRAARLETIRMPSQG